MVRAEGRSLPPHLAAGPIIRARSRIRNPLCELFHGFTLHKHTGRDAKDNARSARRVELEDGERGEELERTRARIASAGDTIMHVRDEKKGW